MKQIKLNYFFKKSSTVSTTTPSESASATSTARDVSAGPSRETEMPTVENASSSGLRPTHGSSGKRKFQRAWLDIFPWLAYDSDRAKCTICAKYPQNSDPKWVAGFSGSMKKETFVFHGKSLVHMDNLTRFEVESEPGKAPLAKCIKKIESSMFEHLTTLFNIAYFIGINEKPFTDFPKQVALATKLGVNVETKQYVNDKNCQVFINFIAKQLQEDVVQKLKNAQCFSILIDGSTDRSAEEHVIVYARYVCEGEIREDLLGLVPLESGRAESYFTAVTGLLDNLGLDWRREKYMVSVGTDGASSMIGSKSGFVLRLKEEAPHLISIHCAAHRLQLAILDAANSIPYLEKLDETVKNIYKFYKRSSKRLHELKNTAKTLESEIVKLRNIHNVRWLCSKSDALKALRRDLVPLVIHLEDITNRKATTGEATDAARAKGYLKILTSYKFVKTLNFLIDLYGKLEPFCKVLQLKQLLVSQVRSSMMVTVEMVQFLLSSEGSSVKQFLSDTSDSEKLNCSKYKGDQGIVLTNTSQGEEEYKSIRNKLIESTVHYLKCRLDTLETVVGTKCHVLDFLCLPQDDTLTAYGNEEILQLAHVFITGDINEDVLLSEWLQLKMMVKEEQITSKGLGELLKTLYKFPERFGELKKVFYGVACMAVTTASCERGFSFVNRIKVKQRLSLDITSLGDLMQLAVNGPPLEDFNPGVAIDKWYFSSGLRHVSGHKRKHSA